VRAARRVHRTSTEPSPCSSLPPTTENGERLAENGERFWKNGERLAENGERFWKNGERLAENGERLAEKVELIWAERA